MKDTNQALTKARRKWLEHSPRFSALEEPIEDLRDITFLKRFTEGYKLIADRYGAEHSEFYKGLVAALDILEQPKKTKQQEAKNGKGH